MPVEIRHLEHHNFDKFSEIIEEAMNEGFEVICSNLNNAGGRGYKALVKKEVVQGETSGGNRGQGHGNDDEDEDDDD